MRAAAFVFTAPASLSQRKRRGAVVEKCSGIQEFNKSIELIRAGRGRELVPEGKTEVSIKHPQVPNLYIRVHESGEANWTVRYKKLGKAIKIAIGKVQVLDHAKAIKAAKDLLSKAHLYSYDPIAAREARRAADQVTFISLVPGFIAYMTKEGKRLSTINNRQRYLTGYYVRPLHDRPVDEITKKEIQPLIKRVEEQASKRAGRWCERPGTRSARSVCNALHAFFEWMLKYDHLPEDRRNPMAHVRKPKENPARARVLDDDEIRTICKACDAMETEIFETNHEMRKKRSGHAANITGPRVVKLLLLTGMRRDEASGLLYSELNELKKEIRISGTRTKNGYELCLPLTDWAHGIIKSNERRPGDDHVFLANESGTGSRKLEDTVTQINRRIKNTGVAPLKHWTLHDLRRTFRTRLAEIGVSDTVAEALLNHVTGRSKIVRTYDRYTYFEEKKQALAKWEAKLRAILYGPEDPENVVYPEFGERRQAHEPAGF